MQSSRPSSLPLLLLGLLFPTAAAAIYFVALDGHPLARSTYFASKTIQFLLPLLALALLRRSSGGSRWSWQRSLVWGLVSGLAMSAGAILFYGSTLRGGAEAARLASEIADKMRDFRIDEPIDYLAMTLFLSLLHSALEEYYWRWFLFGLARLRMGLRAAILLSSLGFMSHHVIVVSTYVTPGPLTWAVLPASLAIAAGGAVWAVLYERSGSLLAPWLSHVVVDLAVMAVGYDLLWGGTGA